jgi:hypothetical protein
MIYLQDSKIKIHDSTHVAQVFLDLLLLEDTIDQEKEHFYVMHLDTYCVLLKAVSIFPNLSSKDVIR